MKKLNITNTEMANIIIGGIFGFLFELGLNLISQNDLNNQIDEKIEERFKKEASDNSEET